MTLLASYLCYVGHAPGFCYVMLCRVGILAFFKPNS